MPYLSGCSLCSGEEFVIDHNATTDTRAGKDANDILCFAPRTQPAFAEDTEVNIITNAYRQTQFLSEDFFQVHTGEADVRGDNDFAVIVHDARDSHTDGADIL